MRTLLLLSLLATPALADEGVAVIELFTSEGCSSCPPAEALLNELDREAREADRPIYVLAYHVAYWDYLGWKDRFGERSHAERQQVYGERLNSGRVYTPQMVVSGREAFVGSDRAHARAAVQRALTEPAAPVRAQVRREKGAVVAKAPAVPGRALVFALVENGAGSKVTRGENAGRRLRHEGVVRDLVVRAPGDASEARLRLPRGVDARRLEVVVFRQDPADLSIDGARRLALPDR